MIGTRRMSPLMEITFLTVTFLFSILAAKGMYNVTQISTTSNDVVLGLSQATFNTIITIVALVFFSFCYIKVIKGMGTQSFLLVFTLVIAGIILIIPMATLSSIGILGKYTLTNTLQQEVTLLESKANSNVKIMEQSRQFFNAVHQDLNGDITITHASATANIKQLYNIIDRANSNQWNSFKANANLLNPIAFALITLLLVVLFYKAIDAGRPKIQKIPL